MAKRTHKYNAKPLWACKLCGLQLAGKKARCTNCAGHAVYFASRKEHRRYCDLILLQRAGHIRELRHQPRYYLNVNDIEVGSYTPDFEYQEIDTFGAERWVVEDTKSKATMTEAARLRIKLFEALHGTKVRIT